MEQIEPDPEPVSEKGQLWGALRDAWRGASGIFKCLLLGVPGLLLFSMVAWGLAGESARRGVERRAAIVIEEDFQTDLDGWFGARDWSKNWERHKDGFIRIGQLALYRPSIRLSDYELEFLGQADSGGLGWVFRAADLGNYYAMKLAIQQRGQTAAMSLVRYAVIGGHESQRMQIPIREDLRAGRAYKIEVKVTGSGFTTRIDGRLVDYWSDERLKAGGVGFFSDAGDDDSARVYWMKVAHNDDLLGRICALIAPPG